MPDAEINVTEIAESIGSDLFGAGDSGTGGDQSPGSSSGDAGFSPPQQTTPAGTPSSIADPSQTPAPSIHPMPKAWKKDKEELWKSLTPAHQEYLTAREQDVLKGLEMYSGSHKQWNELIQPFQPVLQQHPNVNPVQVLQQLMRNHLALVQSTPEQKRELAQRLLKSYGIDLGGAASAQGTQPPALPPEIASRLSKVDSLEQTILTFQRQQQEAAIAENTRLVEAFAKDPKNEYFEEVADDIARFLQTGAAADLASAYELACYANPAVRAKIIAKTSAPQTPPAKPPTNLDGSGEGTPITRKPATIDDTIMSVVNKHYGPH